MKIEEIGELLRGQVFEKHGYRLEITGFHDGCIHFKAPLSQWPDSIHSQPISAFKQWFSGAERVTE